MNKIIQQCSTCQWWGNDAPKFEGKDFMAGSCDVPFPDSLKNKYPDQYFMTETEGTKCKSYKVRDHLLEVIKS